MRNDKLTKPEQSLEKTEVYDWVEKLQSFLQKLSKQPPKEEIRQNKQANNADYLPISFIENKLDEIFMGLWSNKNFTSRQIANELVGQIEIEFFHPTAKVWLTRTGVAAVPIQFKSGSDITDITNKIKNTLVKDYPHLKSECIKNAAKSIGKMFGRDLNREYVDTYSPEYIVPQDPELSFELDRTLESYSDSKELRKNKDEIVKSFVEKGLKKTFVEKKINECNQKLSKVKK